MKLTIEAAYIYTMISRSRSSFKIESIDCFSLVCDDNNSSLLNSSQIAFGSLFNLIIRRDWLSVDAVVSSRGFNVCSTFCSWSSRLAWIFLNLFLITFCVAVNFNMLTKHFSHTVYRIWVVSLYMNLQIFVEIFPISPRIQFVFERNANKAERFAPAIQAKLAELFEFHICVDTEICVDML